MEPKPAVLLIFKEVFKKYFLVLILTKFTAGQQMNKSISANIMLLWSDSLLLCPEISYLLLRNFAAIDH